MTRESRAKRRSFRDSADLENSSSADRELTAKEVGKFLSRLSRLYNNKVTGNLALSRSLKYIAEFLEAKGSLQIWEVLDIESEDDSVKKWNVTFDSVSSLTPDEVKDYIGSSYLTKSELVQIALERFGFGRSRMEKMNRDRIIEEINNACDQETMLSIISSEAAKNGSGRSS